jgi:UDP-glucuronate 4-epimerase
MRFLITGTAGFLGFHIARRLISAGHIVSGVDGITPFYDITLKQARIAQLRLSGAFSEHVIMLKEREQLRFIALTFRPDIIIHLAAQASTRESIAKPHEYFDANLEGTLNIMEIAKDLNLYHVIVASSSSVYGLRQGRFKETDRTDHPLSLYAATKKAAENIAHSYSYLWKIPTTVVRPFTVFGPWGRPDMALFKFVEAAFAGESVDVFGDGSMQRDFTYIDDLVEVVARLIDHSPQQGQPLCEFDSLSPVAPYRVVNIGAGKPICLEAAIDAVEEFTCAPLRRRYIDMQRGDVSVTCASTDLLSQVAAYTPSTEFDVGLKSFIKWYREYYMPIVDTTVRLAEC